MYQVDEIEESNNVPRHLISKVVMRKNIWEKPVRSSNLVLDLRHVKKFLPLGPDTNLQTLKMASAITGAWRLKINDTQQDLHSLLREDFMGNVVGKQFTFPISLVKYYNRNEGQLSTSNSSFDVRNAKVTLMGEKQTLQELVRFAHQGVRLSREGRPLLMASTPMEDNPPTRLQYKASRNWEQPSVQPSSVPLEEFQGLAIGRFALNLLELAVLANNEPAVLQILLAASEVVQADKAGHCKDLIFRDLLLDKTQLLDFANLFNFRKTDQNLDGCTFLHLVVMHYPAIVEKVVDFIDSDKLGLNTNQKFVLANHGNTFWRKTPVHFSCRFGNGNCLR